MRFCTCSFLSILKSKLPHLRRPNERNLKKPSLKINFHSRWSEKMHLKHYKSVNLARRTYQIFCLFCRDVGTGIACFAVRFFFCRFRTALQSLKKCLVAIFKKMFSENQFRISNFACRSSVQDISIECWSSLSLKFYYMRKKWRCISFTWRWISLVLRTQRIMAQISQGPKFMEKIKKKILVRFSVCGRLRRYICLLRLCGFILLNY